VRHFGQEATFAAGEFNEEIEQIAKGLGWLGVDDEAALDFHQRPHQFRERVPDVQH
jgi:hypothetical protein